MHWTLTRQDNNQTLPLHPQFVWIDEFDWTPLAQSTPEYSLTGALHIQQGTRQAGRPITLNGDDTRTTRADVAILQAWASVPELSLRLTHPKGRSWDVIFARPAIESVPVVQYRPHDDSDDDSYICQLYFLTV